MLGLNGLFGVGQFGSQISLMISQGIIYYWRPEYSVFHYAIAPFTNAIRGLMTEWYTLYGIGQSSMVLGYPLVSFIGFFDKQFGIGARYGAGEESDLIIRCLEQGYKVNYVH